MKEYLRKPFVKYPLFLVGGYIALLVVILALSIFSIFITFTFVIIDTLTDSESLGAFAETYFVPKSEFLWSLFLKLIPGL